MKKDLRIFQPGEWADGDIITAIDASQTETPRRPQLNVGILLWPEFPLLALAGLTDALRHAADMGDDSQKIRCSWRLMSATPDRPVLSSSGMAMMPDSAFVAPEQFDYVVVIGGLLRSMAKADRAARRYLHLAHQLNIPLVGICTGSFVLAQEGFLNGLMAAIHP
ncbi:DJ-1/PfpI family protein [Citrobacter portucalensis]|nr:DJ-1/PfpI family protein [Citrobacter portucalensis]